MGLQPYELSARTTDWGLGVNPVAPKWPGGYDPAKENRSRLTFFVHGYNNVLADAERVWRRSTWPKLQDELSDKQLREIVLFYWPGDVAKSRLVTASFYPILIHKASKAAVELANYIRGLGGGRQTVKVQFVAHSLGCLVVLETLRLIKNATNIEVQQVLLMAAAVPEGKCGPKGEFSARVATQYEEVLFSSKDRVLKFFFMPGQALGLEFVLAGPSAVGRTGGPSGRWKPYHPDTHLGHGDYWGHGSSVEKIIDLVSAKRHPPRVKERGPKSRQTSEGWIAPRRTMFSRAPSHRRI